jgi:hypothetical protein
MTPAPNLIEGMSSSMTVAAVIDAVEHLQPTHVGDDKTGEME